jgi:hypothetical protein
VARFLEVSTQAMREVGAEWGHDGPQRRR